MNHVTSILGYFYETTGIPLYITNKDGKHIMSFPLSETPFLLDIYSEYALQDFETQKRDEMHPLVLVTEQSYYTGVVKLTDNEYIIMGPIGQFPHTRMQILEFCSSVVYPEKLLEFCDILATTPLMSYRKFCTALILAVHLCTDKHITHENINLFQVALNVTESEIDKQLFECRERFSYHSPKSYEQGILDAIESGDIIVLKKKMMTPLTGDVGQMSSSLLMQERYTFITFVTLLTRAAIKGGLNYEVACSISDVYCRQMDNFSRVQDISALSMQMAVDFCSKVAETHGIKEYSYAIKTCCEYIMDYLHSDIKLSDLSDLTGLDAKVISRKFHKETGLQIREYIHRERMKEAKYLLKHTTQSIVDIGTYLKYNSQSYFTKVFRETCGCTPQEYRNNKD